MNRIDTILKNEKSNLDRIFIYLVDGQFVAFDRSSFFVALLCPQLEVNWGMTDAGGSYFYIYISDTWLHWLSEKHNTLADDESIRITPPLSISRQRDYFEYWEVQQLYKHGITK